MSQFNNLLKNECFSKASVAVCGFFRETFLLPVGREKLLVYTEFAGSTPNPDGLYVVFTAMRIMMQNIPDERLLYSPPRSSERFPLPWPSVSTPH
jgi:hypothetical protein